MDYTVHGILQARILERVAFPFSRGSSEPKDQTHTEGEMAKKMPEALSLVSDERNSEDEESSGMGSLEAFSSSEQTPYSQSEC